jgi:CheY-like chemotaxis protein
MKLEALRGSHVRRALEIYLARAYPGGVPEHLPRLEVPQEAAGIEALAGFERSGDRSPRFVLRAGNARYPFMKISVQEHLLAGEYSFFVDTHDALKVKPSFPDFEAWVELKRFNQSLKEAIEGEWEREGLPTAAALRAACEARAQLAPATSRGPRVLVVDDERELALGTSALLRARGYRVDVTFGGREALERIRRDPPDLVLLDVTMPDVDGFAVLEALRASPATARLPVVLSTAGAVDPSQLTPGHALLEKPFHREILDAFLDRVFAVSPPSPPADRAL